ncbi:unnamed protein product [Oppiella nova]|uniref:Uncharacterized protein n=1 Tax=Oppiella nova TaxID=334625 RepID=A0A7R9M3Q0_9ACAR|nr:unnamed protein product [Oppiella nova]CAG2170161.1 unnamed protein product [Oppiella nova]
MITTVIAVVFFCIALSAVDKLSSEMIKGSSSWDQSSESGSSNSPLIRETDSTPNPNSWSWTQTNSEDHVNTSVLIPVVIVVGLIVLAIQSIGAIGAYKEHYCLSMTYAILLTISTLLIHMPMIVASKI